MKVLCRPAQLVVTLCAPGLAFELTVTVAVDVSPPIDLSLVVGKALELTVLFCMVQASPLTVMTSWPPRAMTLGWAVTEVGSFHAAAVGAASPRTATAAADAARARVVRM
ncbi:hypothetical protein GCM10010344_34210 [Streptomyces bluensis]|nr:hypothetical protein GCM10010344_34210 [Streptomyces bluensis]